MSAEQPAANVRASRLRILDLDRTCLQEAFFARFQFGSLDEYLKCAADYPIELAKAAETLDLTAMPYSGWTYWLIHLKGYAEYLKAGTVTPENTYFRYLRDYYAPQVQDPGISEGLGDAQALLARITNRYAGFDVFREHIGGTLGARVLPLRVITSDPPRLESLAVFEAGSETPVFARLVDGWHRLFAGRLCRIRDLRYHVEAENRDLPEMYGAIEQAQVTDGELSIRGWCVAPEEVSLVELRAGGETLACAAVSARKDVQEHWPGIPHALMSGFALKGRLPAQAEAGVELSLLGLDDWLPVGRLTLKAAGASDGAGQAYIIERKKPPQAMGDQERGQILSREDPEGLPTELSERDEMLGGSRPHYFSVGRSALQAIRLAMRGAGIATFRNILDLPCGHGRVLRWLRAEFPLANITACDLLGDGVDYCAKSFCATPVYSSADPAQIPLSGQFDLIWVGSLLTHLDAAPCVAFLDRFRSLLVPGGLLVFTVHGRYVRSKLSSGTNTYGLEHGKVASLMGTYDRTGFGYGDYPGQRGFGISVSSPSWVCARIEELGALQLVSYTERGWDRHQDVVACVRI